MKTASFFLISFVGLTCVTLTGFSDNTKKQKVVKSIDSPISNTPKVLDLSLPMPLESVIESKTTAQIKPEFVEKPKKIQRDVELDTQTIMSIEPEVDKIKSVDGASITINLKR